ncbi:MAG TPA: hypothetical protein QF517_02255 [Pseudomonadales bacterium]|jgi:hypothetical protein|nr:hypothetical protein [Pseudomonadales bacterium]MDP6316593.1 hypothetical protein [Pseudomonadales bacterium]MDP7315988.1 hypothetical protein [Pseudomonadales bacterium]HJL60752.1 hypothetical protein [Pseudomonadales bacterium]HJP51101.1 hypothetical protein [Pseudomonadales bacterium]
MNRLSIVFLSILPGFGVLLSVMAAPVQLPELKFHTDHELV